MNQDIMAEAPSIIKEFLGYVGTIKGKSPKTMEEYYLDLRTFFRYIKKTRGLVPPTAEFEEISISDVDLDLIKTINLTQVYEYMNYLGSSRHNKAATRSRKVSSLRTFFKYLTNKTGKLAVNPVEELETPKLKKSLPKYLTLEQSIDLLSKAEGPHKERDYCMLVLFLNCGMRLSELVSLNLSDIRHGSSTLKITGKGNKERMIYLNDACIDALERYIAVRPKNVIDKNALFISKQNKRISPKTVQYIVKKYLAEIDLNGPGFSVHKLRHTAATLMYQHGHVDIRVLKDILGHENLGTTQIYTHLSDEQMEKAAQANPLSGIKQRTGAKKTNPEQKHTAEQEEQTETKKEPE